MTTPTKAQSAFHRMCCDLQTMSEVMQSYDALFADRGRLRAALAECVAVTEREDAHLANFGEFENARAALAQSDKGE